MKPVAVSIQIQAEVDDVFTVFSDFEHVEERVRDITKLEILSDIKTGLGTRWRETRVMFGKEATEEMEITGWEPSQSYKVEAESHGSHYTSQYHFEPRDGGTHVSMTFEARPLTFMARVMGLIMGFMMRGTITKCFKNDMTDLKQFLEAPKPVS